MYRLGEMRSQLRVVSVFLITIAGLIAVVICSAHAAPQEARCEGYNERIAVGEGRASANWFRNLFDLSNSLRAEVNSLLFEAIEKAEDSKKPTGSCYQECSKTVYPEVSLRAEPYKSNERKGQHCKQFINETARDPVKVSGLVFDDRDDIFDWIADFVRGKGESGELLVRRCKGECSARYTFKIAILGEDRYGLTAFARCGYPRDREDNTYDVKANYTWSCGSPETYEPAI